ncbi:hypothetical protein H257_10506 [Aphanomyces astaci]|uniref:Uncharacterized protein n=1 Tax=Aphanomyces astaci TaxID=112090 RepID=W4G6J3_APHAT|nr:hypothetical protein H257_10506 [Aphanomyces astaci]ETV75327.1 hypothetical protein H257_10506 [Aphanomyces astaci]|eukprot:XP_009835375.1 hypothetical protein H257_10506 [Aphanomyces astaci]
MGVQQRGGRRKDERCSRGGFGSGRDRRLQVPLDNVNVFKKPFAMTAHVQKRMVGTQRPWDGLAELLVIQVTPQGFVEEKRVSGGVGCQDSGQAIQGASSEEGKQLRPHILKAVNKRRRHENESTF